MLSSILNSAWRKGSGVLPWACCLWANKDNEASVWEGERPIFLLCIGPMYVAWPIQCFSCIFLIYFSFFLLCTTFGRVTSVYCYKSVSCGISSKIIRHIKQGQIENNIQLSVPKGKKLQHLVMTSSAACPPCVGSWSSWSNFTNMDTKTKMFSSNVLLGGENMKWFESKCFSRQLFRQMQQRDDDGFSKTPTYATYTCHHKNVRLKTSAGRNQYCTQIFFYGAIQCVIYILDCVCFQKMKYIFDEHTHVDFHIVRMYCCANGVDLNIHRMYTVQCTQMSMWSTNCSKIKKIVTQHLTVSNLAVHLDPKAHSSACGFSPFSCFQKWKISNTLFLFKLKFWDTYTTLKLPFSQSGVLNQKILKLSISIWGIPNCLSQVKNSPSEVKISETVYQK